MGDLDSILKRLHRVGTDPGHDGETCCDGCRQLVVVVEELISYMKRLAEAEAAQVGYPLRREQ